MTVFTVQGVPRGDDGRELGGGWLLLGVYSTAEKANEAARERAASTATEWYVFERTVDDLAPTRHVNVFGAAA